MLIINKPCLNSSNVCYFYLPVKPKPRDHILPVINSDSDSDAVACKVSLQTSKIPAKVSYSRSRVKSPFLEEDQQKHNEVSQQMSVDKVSPAKVLTDDETAEDQTETNIKSLHERKQKRRSDRKLKMEHQRQESIEEKSKFRFIRKRIPSNSSRGAIFYTEESASEDKPLKVGKAKFYDSESLSSGAKEEKGPISEEQLSILREKRVRSKELKDTEAGMVDDDGAVYENVPPKSQIYGGIEIKRNTAGRNDLVECSGHANELDRQVSIQDTIPFSTPTNIYEDVVKDKMSSDKKETMSDEELENEEQNIYDNAKQKSSNEEDDHMSDNPEQKGSKEEDDHMSDNPEQKGSNDNKYDKYSTNVDEDEEIYQTVMKLYDKGEHRVRMKQTKVARSKSDRSTKINRSKSHKKSKHLSADQGFGMSDSDSSYFDDDSFSDESDYEEEIKLEVVEEVQVGLTLLLYKHHMWTGKISDKSHVMAQI